MGRFGILLAMFLAASVLATAMPVSAAPRVAIIQVKGMVCSA